MRIIAGTHRGTALASVGKGDTGAHLRPTTDRVRENLFNILMGGRFGDPITSARVLDLFAGTGALGVEALSRGADSACFVDNSRKALSLIRENLKITRLKDRTYIRAENAAKLSPCITPPFNLIFLDPPYGKGMGQKALTAAYEGNWIAAGALIVFEENSAQPAPHGFDLLDSHRFGDTYVTFLRFCG